MSQTGSTVPIRNKSLGKYSYSSQQCLVGHKIQLEAITNKVEHWEVQHLPFDSETCPNLDE